MEADTALDGGLGCYSGHADFGSGARRPRSGIVAFVVEGQESAHIAHRLDREYQIAVRAGMHCTPLAHQAADTLDSGAVRASVGVSSTEADVQRLLLAMEEMYGASRSS